MLTPTNTARLAKDSIGESLLLAIRQMQIQIIKNNN